MPRRNFLDITEEQANKSDSDDEDYDNSQNALSKRKRTKPASKSTRRAKRRRQSYASNSDDEITDEVDELLDDDLMDTDEEPHVNPETGRPSRRATLNRKNLRESSDEDVIEDVIEDDGAITDASTSTHPRDVLRLDVSDKPRVQMLLTAFAQPPTPASRRSSRSQAASSAFTHGRRTTRASQEPETMMQLDAKGRPISVSRPTTASSDHLQRPTRATRYAAKKPFTHQNPIFEENEQEDSEMEDKAEEDLNLLRPDVIAESPAPDPQMPQDDQEEDDDDDEDDRPMKRTRAKRTRAASEEEAEFTPPPPPPPPKATRSARNSTKKAVDESSDFDPEEVGADDDGDDDDDDDEDNNGRQTSSWGRSRKARRTSMHSAEDDLDPDELAEEAHDLNKESRKRRRGGYEPPSNVHAGRPKRHQDHQPNYTIFRPGQALEIEEAEEVAPSRRKNGNKLSAYYRSLYPTAGAFGGAGEEAVFTDPNSRRLAAGADSDDSDDEGLRKPPGLGGNSPPPARQGMASDAAQATGGGSTALGKVPDRKTMADADPLGQDPNISMDDVGGLQDHIQKLNEMVKNPLMYPDLYKDKGITPPRGVLFHGPPGTGKTLLARALAAQVGQDGQKVTFYMRKGADALSKWVGEAERQLRALFDDAKKNQPSIIFFDEIDGLAPVRSSKQEQIHASIVATLLALMDGMDGRGQVVVIGATNRPDSVDPALRRPGRFDREFYFPLPDEKARREILQINTRSWKPALEPQFVDQLAFLTKGYGGADLRALCTESALNAIQGTYPQIYKSSKKLLVDPTAVKVQPKDFMLSLSKMIPSSERNTSSIAAPLDSHIEPLLREPFHKVSHALDGMIPLRQQFSALEEAEFDDREDPNGFNREMMQQRFDKGRVYRPRLLITGLPGMGQNELSAAILHKFERFFVQAFDLAAMHGDASRTPEQALTQMFEEVKRHKPSVIYIPDINVWYESVGPAVINMFKQKLRSLPPSHPVLILGVMEQATESERPSPRMMRDIFPNATSKSVIELRRPGAAERRQYFAKAIDYLKMSPTAFPEEERKKRQLPELEVAPPPAPPPPPTEAERKAQKKAQKKKDRLVFNRMRVAIHPAIEVLKGKREYNSLRKPAVPEADFAYLLDETHPDFVMGDVAVEGGESGATRRPYEFGQDDKGAPGILRTQDGAFFYNMELSLIEKRFHNGHYTRFEDLLSDFKKIAKDRKTLGDHFGFSKAMEIHGGLEVDIESLKPHHLGLFQALEEIHRRTKAEEEEARRMEEEAKRMREAESHADQAEPASPFAVPHAVSGGQSQHRAHPSDAVSEKGGSSQTGDGPASDLNIQQTTSRSQVSAITAMGPGSQAADYHNSASTTTSGHKSSDKTNVSSAPAFGDGPHSGGSQLPDTQEMNLPSGSPSQSSPTTGMGPPQRGPLNVGALLNEAPRESEEFVCDAQALQLLHDHLTAGTELCNIEQLEQVMAAVMDTIWRLRGKWDRTVVISHIRDAFDELVRDMHEYADVFLASQPDDSMELDH